MDFIKKIFLPIGLSTIAWGAFELHLLSISSFHAREESRSDAYKEEGPELNMSSITNQNDCTHIVQTHQTTMGFSELKANKGSDFSDLSTVKKV